MKPSFALTSFLVSFLVSFLELRHMTFPTAPSQGSSQMLERQCLQLVMAQCSIIFDSLHTGSAITTVTAVTVLAYYQQ